MDNSRQYTRSLAAKFKAPLIPEVASGGAHNFTEAKTARQVADAAAKIVEILRDEPYTTMAFTSTVKDKTSFIEHCFTLRYNRSTDKNKFLVFEDSNGEILWSDEYKDSPIVKLVNLVSRALYARLIVAPVSKTITTEAKALTGAISSTTGWCFAYARLVLRREREEDM